MPIIALALLLAAALGGGVSVAANQSLPGDTLYGFKVHVNEGVESALALNNEAKANFDISAAQERLDEAQKLAAEGNLDADAQAEIDSNFSEHAQSAAKAIAALQAAGQYDAAATVAARFQSILADRASTFTQASVTGDAELKASLSPLVSKIRATLEQASALSTEASAKASSHESDGTEVESTSSETEVRASGNMKVKGADDSTELNTDGSVKVNVY